MTGVCPIMEHDVTALAALLPELEPAFVEGADTIFIRRQPGSRPRDVVHQLASVATRYMCHPPIAVALDAVAQHLDGRLARAMLRRMPTGTSVEPHTDEGAYAVRTVRYHLPILTNPGAWLAFEGHRFHLDAGTVYAIDKHISHAAANEGGGPMVHLVFDLVPDAFGVLA